MCLASTWSCIANFRNGSSSECWPPEGCRRDCVRLALALAHEWSWPLLRGSVYFLAQVDPSTIPADPQAQWAMCMNLPGCIELTWNYGPLWWLEAARSRLAVMIVFAEMASP